MVSGWRPWAACMAAVSRSESSPRPQLPVHRQKMTPIEESLNNEPQLLHS